MIDTYDITGELVIDDRARDWCKWPYRDYPKGCPMYGTRPECPPQAPLVKDFIRLDLQQWLIVYPFDIKLYAQLAKNKHPDWSERQCRNPRHWQGHARWELRCECEDHQKKFPGAVFTLIPEAMGVHVIRTARKFGVPINKNPKDYVYKIALVGYPVDQKRLFDY